MSKGQTHHAKGLESKWDWRTANTYDFYLPITVMWAQKSYITDDINKQIYVSDVIWVIEIVVSPQYQSVWMMTVMVHSSTYPTA